MLYSRIHVLGAPGSGVSTLGQNLAERFGMSAFDTDDYHWFTSDPLPYKRKRNVEHRMKLLQDDLEITPRWVLSGALCGWGDALIPQFDLVVYLWSPVETRLQRICERETARYGADRLAEGGDLHVVYHKFLDWAARYDTAEGLRSRTMELAWLTPLTCKVVMVEDELTKEKLVEWVVERLAGSR